MEKRLYVIPEARVAEFEKQVKSLARKAARLKLPPPSVQEVGFQFKSVFDEAGLIRRDLRGNLIKERFTEYSVTNDTVQLPGWRFVGVVQHTKDGNILRVVSEHPDIEDHRHQKPSCDHCQKSRKRKDTYLVADSNNKLKRVGSNCLLDYTGTNCLARLEYQIKCFSFDDLEDDLEERLNGWRSQPRFDIESVLVSTLAYVRKFGWVSGGKALALSCASTADWVRNYMLNPTGHREDDIDLSLVTKRDASMIIDARKWILGPGAGHGDYIMNLRIACTPDYISTREFGLVCSLVSTYQRELEKDAQSKAMYGSQHIGSIGDRIGGKLTAKDKKAGRQLFPPAAGKVVVFRILDTHYGTKTLIKVLSDNGDVITWWATGSDFDVSIGQRVVIQGRIKKHGEYQGIRDTVVGWGDVSPA